MELSDVKWFKLNTAVNDPEKKTMNVKPGDLASAKDQKITDFSSGPRPLTVINTPDANYGQFSSRLDDNSIRKNLEGKNLYQLRFKNNGGLVSPIIIEWTYKDGTKEVEKIAAEIWRTNEQEVTKIFSKEKEVVGIVIDPQGETADVNTDNNSFPKKPEANKFDQLKKEK
jgi:hypothetical protein